MPEVKRSVTQYKVEFYTDGDQNEALTTHFNTLRIINSTRSIWPIFHIYFEVDNQIFIEKNIYGKSDITCKVKISYEDGSDSRVIEFKLLYLEAKIDLPPKEEKNGTIQNQKDVQRRFVVMHCLAKPAVQAMSKFVNKLWEEPTELTPIDIVKEILDDNDLEYLIKDEGQNEDTIQQMLIPPMTIRSAIDYINQNYGIFSGPIFRYCNYSGKILMWDLKKMWEKTKDSPWVKFHKSPSHFTTEGKFEEINRLAKEKDDEYVIYENTESIHHANANLLRYAYDNIYIFHPHEDIVVFQKKNVDEIIKDYGIWHKKEEMKYHPDLKDRKLYFHDMVGMETDDGYSGEYNNFILTQDMATSFQNAASVRIEMYRNVKFPLALKVGEVMYIEPYSEFEKFKGSNYKGGYLISDADLVLTRSKTGSDENMDCTAVLTGYRTAQSMD